MLEAFKLTYFTHRYPLSKKREWCYIYRKVVRGCVEACLWPLYDMTDTIATILWHYWVHSGDFSVWQYKHGVELVTAGELTLALHRFYWQSRVRQVHAQETLTIDNHSHSATIINIVMFRNVICHNFITTYCAHIFIYILVLVHLFYNKKSLLLHTTVSVPGSLTDNTNPLQMFLWRQKYSTPRTHSFHPHFLWMEKMKESCRVYMLHVAVNVKTIWFSVGISYYVTYSRERARPWKYFKWSST